MPVRVRESHRIAERRGMVGRVVGTYGGEEFIAVEVQFQDGERRLFWPGDLEAQKTSWLTSSVRSWWGSLLRGA